MLRPPTNTPASECANPEGRLGLTVGWGDQYESTDGGEDINITNVPNGTYWFQAEADPYHYFAESSSSDKLTDTKLQIEGDTVKVLEQTHPDSTPPSIALTSPAEGSTASGSVTLDATATGPAPIKSVQFLLDGQPLGEPVTTAPYSTTWAVGNTPPGTYYLSAQATDSDGFVGTAPALAVTVPKRLGTVNVVGTASGIGTNEARTTALTTTGTNELLLAFAGADGPKSAGSQSLTVSGGGLIWSLVRRANTEAGDAEIWSATAPGPLSGATFSAKAAESGYDTSLTVAAVTGAAGIGNSAAAGAASGAPIVSMTAGNAGSEFFATGDDWDNAVKRTLAPGQALLSEYLDTGGGDTYWTQYAESSSGMPGETRDAERHRSDQGTLESRRG